MGYVTKLDLLLYNKICLRNREFNPYKGEHKKKQSFNVASTHEKKKHAKREAFDKLIRTAFDHLNKLDKSNLRL